MIRLRRSFPGYIFLRADVVKSSVYQALRQVPRFVRFLPANDRIQPLEAGDLKTVTHFLSFGEVVDKSKVIFDENNRIKVISGPMMGLEGRIVKVDRRKGRARVRLELYENSFDVDFGFEHLEQSPRPAAETGAAAAPIEQPGSTRRGPGRVGVCPGPGLISHPSADILYQLQQGKHLNHHITLAVVERTRVLFHIAFRNIIRGGRKNFVVAILIAVGVGAFFTGNAVLQSSVGGIQRTFSDNFTADLSVSQRSDQSFGIFGPDIPIIGGYESEPLLLNAAEIGSRLAVLPGVAGLAYVLSSPILVEVGGARNVGLGLGVIGDEYFDLFPGAPIRRGRAPSAGDHRVGCDHGRVGKKNRRRAGANSRSRGEAATFFFP